LYILLPEIPQFLRVSDQFTAISIYILR
jgi:hypothetical protein